MKNKKYLVGVIGCGNIASLFDNNNQKEALTHLGAYANNLKTQVIAICDNNLENLKNCQRKWKIEKTYINYKNMLAKEPFDILSICTPPETHYSMVMEAAKYNIKAIYCEKPICFNSVGAEKMIRICQEKKIILMINHQRRFNPFYYNLLKKMKKGLLGEIKNVNCIYTRGIYNTGSHLVDLFNFLFGKAKWVKGELSNVVCHNDVNINGKIKYKSGVIINLQSWNDNFYNLLEIDILGTKGRLLFKDKLEFFLTQNNTIFKKKILIRKNNTLLGQFNKSYLDYGVKHLIDCLETQKEPISSGKTALENIRIIENLILSAKTNRKILLQ